MIKAEAATQTREALRKSELAALIKYFDEHRWPEGVDAGRAHYDSLGPPIAPDIQVEPMRVDGIGAQMLIPPVCDGRRVLLYLHGGGYVYGSLVSHGGMAAEVARAAQCKVLQLDYRRPPEHPFPAAVEDATAAYRWLLNQDFSPGRIAIAGDSAGGGLVLASMTVSREQGLPLPGAAVCLSPWVDLTASGESYKTREALDPYVRRKTMDRVIRLYLNGQDPRTPTVSPIYADLIGFPPLLIQVADREIVFSDSETLAQKAKACGVDVTFEEWRDAVHVWHLHYLRFSAGLEAIERIGQFVIQKTGAHPSSTN